jgi:hypothetical protein
MPRFTRFTLDFDITFDALKEDAALAKAHALAEEIQRRWDDVEVTLGDNLRNQDEEDRIFEEKNLRMSWEPSIDDMRADCLDADPGFTGDDNVVLTTWRDLFETGGYRPMPADPVDDEMIERYKSDTGRD